MYAARLLRDTPHSVQNPLLLAGKPSGELHGTSMQLTKTAQSTDLAKQITSNAVQQGMAGPEGLAGICTCRAAEGSTELILACGRMLLTSAACRVFGGSGTSSVYKASPVTCASA